MPTILTTHHEEFMVVYAHSYEMTEEMKDALGEICSLELIDLDPDQTRTFYAFFKDKAIVVPLPGQDPKEAFENYEKQKRPANPQKFNIYRCAIGNDGIFLDSWKGRTTEKILVKLANSLDKYFLG